MKITSVEILTSLTAIMMRRLFLSSFE